MTRVEFRILGPLEVEREGRAVVFAGEQSRTLLCLLLINRTQALSADRLVDALWGDPMPPRATKRLQVAISRLRTSLESDGAEVVRSERLGYRLDVRPGALDADRFEQLATRGETCLLAGESRQAAATLADALRLWRGPALADVADASFAQNEIRRLEELRLATLERRLEADLQLGRHASVIAELQAAVAAHPTRETLTGLEMLALYRCGRQSDALAAYQRRREYLLRELGLDPGAPLQQLQAHVLAHDPSLDFQPHDGAATTASQAAARPAKPWRFFVGRAREFGELKAALAAARRGHGDIVLMSGEAGIGKTALLGLLGEHAAAEGVRVVWGRGWSGGGAPPFWPWGQVVDQLWPEADDEALEAALGARARRLAPIAPQLGGRLGRPADAPDVERARFALLDSLVGFLRIVSAAGPLLLALDDVDAADTDALLALEFVARELGDIPLLGVATYKAQEIAQRPEATAILEELARTSHRIELTGLAEEELALMLERRTGAEPTADLLGAVQSLTAGNPFFAEEVARTLVPTTQPDGETLLAAPPALPSGVRDAITRRVRTLPRDERHVLAAAAVAGPVFRVAVLQQIAGVDRASLLQSLDGLRAGGLLAVRGAGGMTLGFTHGLVRETVYGNLTSLERARLHQAAGAAVEHVYQGDLEPYLAQLAHHYYEAAAANDNAKAVAYARRAGMRAAATFAWDEATRLFQQALDALELGAADPADRAELLVELGRAQGHAGAEEARNTLRDAVAAASERPDLIARAALEVGAFALSPGIVDEELVRMLNAALSAVDVDDTALRVRLLARLGVALYWSGDADGRLAVAEESVAMARRLGEPRTLAYALANWQAAASSPDRTEQCLETADELFQLAAQTGDIEVALSAHVRQIGYLLELGRLVDADTAIETLSRVAEEAHDARAQAYVPLERSRRAALEGDFSGAELLTAEATRLGARLRDSTIPLQAAAQIIGMRWAQGRIGEMRSALKQAADEHPAMPVYCAALALASAEAGDEADARRELRHLAVGDFRAIPRDNVWILAMAFLSEATARLRDPVHARIVYDLLAPFAGRNVVSPDAIYAGPVARYLGIAAAAQHDWDAAERHFRAAWEQAELDGARAMMARTRLDHARALVERGRPEDRTRTGQYLDEAAARAEELELRVVLDLIGRVRRQRGTAPSALTAEP
jgi:DNA-binding SARP family transcriptional activator